MFNFTKSGGLIIFGLGIIFSTSDLIRGNVHSLIFFMDAMLLVIGELVCGWEND